MTGVVIGAWPLDRESWVEVAPMIARIARIDALTPIRLIGRGGRRTALAKLPSGALVSRTVVTHAIAASADAEIAPRTDAEIALTAGAEVAARAGAEVAARADTDVTARAQELWRWLADEQAPAPERADTAWRGARPPDAGWRQIERVPDSVVRELVRQGAAAHTDAANQGLGARAADALLDSAVLTVADAHRTADVTNRSLSALVSMGFMPPGSHVVVAVSRGWTRIAAEYGNAYAEPKFTGLVLA